MKATNVLPRVTAALWSALVSLSALAAQTEADVTKTAVFTLADVHVHGVYPSMTGPIKRESVAIGSAGTAAVLWLKGYRVDVVNERGEPESLEYLCHAWATVMPGYELGGVRELLTISQGMGDMEFPAGYALPIRTDGKANLQLLAQALNNNKDVDKHLSYVMTFSYIEDADAKRLGLKPLHTSTVAVLAAPFTSEPGHAQAGAEPASCHEDANGPSLHFRVPPGRHTFAHQVLPASGFARNARIHYIKLHLHPYGESITLTDKTEKRVIWTGSATNARDRAALTHTDNYVSSAGLAIFADHEYEISSVYDNPTGRDVDAMAVLRVYFDDGR